MNHEYKNCALLELKTEGEPGEFSGYASTYGVDLHGDTITPGAFEKTIGKKKGKVPILYGHDERRHVGFSTALAEDEKGLAFTGALITNSRDGADAYALLQKAQALDYHMGMSIGFIAEDADYTDDGRIIKKIDLWEISITPFPAQPKATVRRVKSLRDLAAHLRDVEGFTESDARRIVRACADFKSSDGETPEGITPLMRHVQRAIQALACPTK